MIPRSILPGLMLMVVLGPAFGAEPNRAVVLRGAVLETAAKAGRIDNGTLVLRGGKIEAVGTDVKAPDDAEVIDVRGMTILPGMIDPFREVTIAAGGGDSAPPTIIRGGRPITFPGRFGGGGGGFTRVADNFYPYETSYRTFLRSGLTGLNLVTSSYSQAAVVRVTPAAPDAMLLKPDGILFTPGNDSSSLDTIRTALGMVGQRGGSGGQPTGDPGRHPGGPGGGGGSFGNVRLWQDIAEGKSPLFVSVTSAASVVQLLKVLEPHKSVKLVLAAPGPVLQETLDLLAGRSVQVLVRPGLSLKPNTRDRIDVARLLHEAGVEFAFTQPATQAELLATQDSPLFAVAYSVRCGLPRKAAIEALTARPAALIGLDKTHGTLEAGKSADLLLFKGDPLDPESQLARVLIEGRTVHEN